MKQNFREQFVNLKSIIEKNVETLKSLLKQSETLSELIQKVDGSTECEIKVKHELESAKKEIRKSIDSLVDQTQKLFEVYDKLVDEVFGK